MTLETSTPAGAPIENGAPPDARQVVADEPRVFVASQWQLIWWKFRKHQLAMASAVIIALGRKARVEMLRSVYCTSARQATGFLARKE